MPNPVKGEAALTLKDGRKLTLAYDFDAMVEVEEVAGVGFNTVLQRCGEAAEREEMPPLKMMRALLAGGLHRHHADIPLNRLGDLLLSDGEAIGTAISTALSGAMGGAAAARPPKGTGKPSPGTGTRSSKAGPKRG